MSIYLKLLFPGDAAVTNLSTVPDPMTELGLRGRSVASAVCKSVTV